MHNPIDDYRRDDTPVVPQKPQQSHIPAYGQRKGWKPKGQNDFNGGGAYPECHVAQYPLDMGRKQASSGNTLALQVDAEGNVRYDAIAQYGTREGQTVHSSFRDLVPLAKRSDLKEKDKELERPSEEAVFTTAERTRLALEKVTSGKIAAARPTTVALKDSASSQYIRYTPASTSDQGKQRIIKMSEVQEDPLEPPRFKHKKIPRAPDGPPPPVMQSPPRRATVQDMKDWQIPPCISNWKNNKGYTIALDKRLAADGRGLQDIHINDNFAKFSEALFIADRHAREEVRERAQMQQKIAQKEKAAKEENLRLLAQRARDERAGIAPSAAVGDGEKRAAPAMKGIQLGGYGSDDDTDSESGDDTASNKSGADDADDDEARERDRIRREKRQEREREMRLNNMGSEQRAKMLMREQNRDISEKIALGLAKPSTNKESMLDSRLFNRESYSGSFGRADSYNLYDKPLFAGSSAAAAIYKPRGNNADDEAYGGGTTEGITDALQNDRFALGTAKFEGASEQPEREGPVQFEKEVSLSAAQVADPFGLTQFMDEAKKGTKRAGLDTSGSSKRARQE
ncbi:mRNA splicing protein [Naganishia vaughanmartiniae]|uniref:mRNA splicing protein n=1 Tax=Naganishia vaughanmartiniae TaxID=1424756 RepID=A0ACC2XS55_9TREE|nr:mRNA splicing protein [Naganishia vaughanmartiniae]